MKIISQSICLQHWTYNIIFFCSLLVHWLCYGDCSTEICGRGNVTFVVTCLRRLDDWDTSCTERRWPRRSIVAVINNPRRCSILTSCHRRWSHDCNSRACPQRLLCRQSHRCTTPSKLYDDVTTSSSEQYFGKTMLDGSPLKKKVGKVITSLQARWPRCRLLDRKA